MRDEDHKPVAAPPPLSREELESLRREVSEISRQVAQDIEALRRRDPQDRLTRWR